MSSVTRSCCAVGDGNGAGLAARVGTTVGTEVGEGMAVGGSVGEATGVGAVEAADPQPTHRIPRTIVNTMQSASPLAVPRVQVPALGLVQGQV